MDTTTTLQRDTEEPVFGEWLRDVLSRIKGEKIDIAALVYNRLQREEDPQAAFRYFLDNADEIDSTKEEDAEQIFTATEIQQLRKKCDSLIEGILNRFLSENDSEGEFYNRLWTEGVCGNTLLQSDKERIYALYKIWQDGRIPYFQLDEGLAMTNEQFGDCCNKNRQLIKKAFFIINSAFSQRSQQSDLLLEVLKECETDEDKAVVMAQILGHAEMKGWLSLYERVRTERVKE